MLVGYFVKRKGIKKMKGKKATGLTEKNEPKSRRKKEVTTLKLEPELNLFKKMNEIIFE